MLPRSGRGGDGREVVGLEHAAGLFAGTDGLIAPAEVACLFSRVQPQVSSPADMVAVGVSQRRGEGEHPFAHLEVVADEVMICPVPSQVRDSEYVTSRTPSC